MSNLSFDREKTNLGGINQFLFLYENRLDTSIEIVKGIVYAISTGAYSFTAAAIVSESADFKETKLDNNLFQYSFTARVAHDDTAKLEDCTKLDSLKIIGIVRDNNGYNRLLGQIGNACELKAYFVKGQKVSDLNHIAIELAWKTNNRSAFVEEGYGDAIK